MTFKDLQRLVQSQSGPEIDQALQRLRDKPFWIWGLTEHKDKHKTHKGNCCFNHTIGLPRKDGIEKPMFDYEGVLYDALLRPGYLNSRPATKEITPDNIAHLFKVRHLWVKKATGLGVTEFMLRFMAWLCLRNDNLKGTQMCIVTGPGIDRAIGLIDRIKKLFEPHDITFKTKETDINLNGVTIRAYPADHLDNMRGLTDVSFILIDEADFFSKHEQQNARYISERYIAKSDPFIVMVSTPNKPGGLFEQIEREPFDKCVYKKVLLDYTYGLNKIYSKEEIDNARMSPGFEREYMLKYQGLIGNVFSTTSIDNALKTQYNPDNINLNAKKSIGLDPGFGSSNFAIVATQLVDGKIQVIHAEEHDRPDFSDMISEVWQLKQRLGHVTSIYVDAANPVVWQSLKKEFDEPFDEKTVREKKAYAIEYNLHVEDQMFIVPVPFAIEGHKMLQHTKWLLEEKEEDGISLIAIDRERFHKLVTALRTAVANEYRLDKEQTSHNDILDAFRLSLQFYKRSKA